jgi:hypothetical protein
MDRFASNTLRTLGIVLISVFVIGGSLIILLLALCLGAIATSGSGPQAHQAEASFGLVLVTALILISGGVFCVAKLSKGIVHETPEFRFAPIAGQPVASPSTYVPPPPATVPAQSPLPKIEPQAAYSVVTHLSPASRAAIRQLAWAIVAKVAAEILIALAGWTLAGRPLPMSLLTVRFSVVAWALAATAPNLILLYALLRHPGPRAFAYSLVIPSLHLFFGVFGHTASIFFLLRAHPGISGSLSLLTLSPWLVDILILYLAIKVIRLTGIQPNSTRLIVASAVIFLYTSFLPVLLFTLDSLWHK